MSEAYKREVVTAAGAIAKAIEILRVEQLWGPQVHSALLADRSFLSLIRVGGNWYQAHFGLVEYRAPSSLEALVGAFLRDKGYEVLD